MKNLWSDDDARQAIAGHAAKGIGEDLALRVYTTRLLGGEPKLVLHGGGNTSAKVRERDPLTGAEVAHADFAACDAFDVRSRLSEIRAPTLIVCGAEDKMTPPKYSEYLTQNIAGAEFHLIENAGHMVMLERPEEFNRVLLDFLCSPA